MLTLDATNLDRMYAAAPLCKPRRPHGVDLGQPWARCNARTAKILAHLGLKYRTAHRAHQGGPAGPPCRRPGAWRGRPAPRHLTPRCPVPRSARPLSPSAPATRRGERYAFSRRRPNASIARHRCASTITPTPMHRLAGRSRGVCQPMRARAVHDFALSFSDPLARDNLTPLLQQAERTGAASPETTLTVVELLGNTMKPRSAPAPVYVSRKKYRRAE